MRCALVLGVLALAPLPARSHPGVGIVMDSRGEVFYTDLKQVWRIARDGTRSVAVPHVHTHELCLDPQDNLYGEHLWYEGEATDRWGYRVWRRSPEGTLIDVIPAHEGFRTDYSFVRDAAGAMYWADRGARIVIRKKTVDGRVSDVCPGCRFQDVMWMTAAPDGTVFLEDGADLVRIRPDGKRFAIAPGLAARKATQVQVGDRHRLMGLWLDRLGSVYVASYGSREVKKVAPDGSVSVAAHSSWPWSPTGGLVSPDGDLWLLEYSFTGAARVRHILKDGSSRSY